MMVIIAKERRPGILNSSLQTLLWCFINFTNRTHEINSWVSVSVSEIEFHIGSKYSPATIEAKSQAGVELKDWISTLHSSGGLSLVEGCSSSLSKISLFIRIVCRSSSRPCLINFYLIRLKFQIFIQLSVMLVLS